MSRRIGLLVASLIVALLGTASVFSYVNRVEANVVAGTEMINVLVAAERMPAGTSAAGATKGDLVQLSSMPRKSVPEGALTSLDEVGEQTLVSDVFAGELLLKAKFADQTARTGALVIPKDMIAISLELEDPQRVAGFVVPGSEVAIFVTIEKLDATAAASNVSNGSTTVNVLAEGDGDYTNLLLPRVSVIAVGPATLRTEKDDKKSSEDEVTKAVLTVAVNQQDAARLVHSAQTGELWFGLLSSSSKTGPGLGVSNLNLFPKAANAR